MSNRATAKIVPTFRGPRVRVDLVSGRSEWPVLWPNGQVAWDNPEIVPKYIKPRAAKLLRELRDRKR